MYVLKKNIGDPLSFEVLYDYFKEVHSILDEIDEDHDLILPGRILRSK